MVSRYDAKKNKKGMKKVKLNDNRWVTILLSKEKGLYKIHEKHGALVTVSDLHSRSFIINYHAETHHLVS